MWENRKNFDGLHEMGGGFVKGACERDKAALEILLERKTVCLLVDSRFSCVDGNRQVFSMRNLHTIIIFRGETDVPSVSEALIDF